MNGLEQIEGDDVWKRLFEEHPEVKNECSVCGEVFYDYTIVNGAYHCEPCHLLKCSGPCPHTMHVSIG